LLSSAQQNQIREIFELFDTDGGGSIDKKELQFALSALGFQREKRMKDRSRETADLLDSILSDGTVTLAEFTALMTGEVMGTNPYEEVQAVFAALSTSDGETRHDNLITLGKLEAACLKFEVRFQPCPMTVLIMWLYVFCIREAEFMIVMLTVLC
jgi:Ca2+-binding EF-hand superfamily protein